MSRFNSNLDTKLFEEIRAELFELINLIEVKIDVGYILEELEIITKKVKNLKKSETYIDSEMEELFNHFYKKYNTKPSSFLSEKEERKLTEVIKSWILKIATIF